MTIQKRYEVTKEILQNQKLKARDNRRGQCDGATWRRKPSCVPESAEWRNCKKTGGVFEGPRLSEGQSGC